MDLAADLAADHAVDAHTAGGLVLRDRRGHVEGGLVDDLLTKKQDLRQDEHDDDDRDDGAAPEAVADTGDGGVGGHLADEDAGDDHHEARGDDRREGEVHGLNDGVLFGHFVLELHEAAGRDDGVVDVRAHLDGRDDQIAEEEQGAVRDGGDAVVDPDTALDDQDQQHRDPGRFEREQQNDQHDQDRQDRHDDIVARERGLEVLLRRGIAHDVHVAVRIIAARDGADLVKEVVGLIAAHGEVQIDEHAAVVIGLQLLFRVRDLRIGVLERLGHIGVERDVAVLHLAVEEGEHIDERHGILGQTADDLAVVAAVGRIGRV